MQHSGEELADRRSVLKTIAAGGALAALPTGTLAQSGGLGSTNTCGTERVQTHRPAGIAWGLSQPDACEIQTGLPGHEPCVRVDSEGTVYYSAVDQPTGIARSTDGGETWETMELPEDYDTAGLDLGSGATTEAGTGNATETGTVTGNATGNQSTTGTEGTTGNQSASGSLDLSREYRRKGTSYLHLDEDTDRLFYGSVGTGPILYSDDGGETWTAGTIPDDVTTWDWPKFFTGPPVHSDTGDYPNVVYYLDFTGEREQTSLFKSTDGGETYEEVSVVGKQGDCTTDENDREQLVHGVGRVHADGTIYVPLHACGNMEIAVSEDEGETWDRRPVDGATYPNGLTQILEWTSLESLLEDPESFNLLQGFEVIPLAQVLAMDDEGTLYVVWVAKEDLQLRVAHSEDGGQTWSDPIAVTPAGVNRAVLPGLAVDESGRLGLSYVGSERGDTWHAYLAEIPDVRQADPKIHTATVSDAVEPVTEEGCCWNGPTASGLFEQTTVDIAPDGSIWGSFVRDNGDSTWEGLVGRIEGDDSDVGSGGSGSGGSESGSGGSDGSDAGGWFGSGGSGGGSTGSDSGSSGSASSDGWSTGGSDGSNETTSSDSSGTSGSDGGWW